MLESGHYSRNGFLTKRGYELAQRTSLEGLSLLSGVDIDEDQLYLDKVASVSGLRRDEDLYADVCDHLLDEQHRRFHNGS